MADLSADRLHEKQLSRSCILLPIRLFINDECGALDAHVFFPVHALFFHDAVQIAHRFLFIGKEREIKFILVAEVAVLFTLSRLTPSTEYPRFLNSSRLARNACASSVHPEVLSFG